MERQQKQSIDCCLNISVNRNNKKQQWKTRKATMEQQKQQWNNNKNNGTTTKATMEQQQKQQKNNKSNNGEKKTKKNKIN